VSKPEEVNLPCEDEEKAFTDCRKGGFLRIIREGKFLQDHNRKWAAPLLIGEEKKRAKTVNAKRMKRK